jgi:hypothetical protein
VFREWCEVRASFYGAGQCSLHDAVDALQDGADRLGLVAKLGQDAVQQLIAAAIAPYRPELAVEESERQESSEAADNDPYDDYAGISHSFARLFQANETLRRDCRNVKPRPASPS